MQIPKSYSGAGGENFELSRLYPKDDARAAEVALRKKETIPFQNYHDAMEQVINGNDVGYREKETWDPPAEWINDIHYRITQKIGLNDFSCLKVHPALGTALDYYHGVDFVVSYTEPETGTSVTVTADLTLNTKKDFYKADVIINRKGAIPALKFTSVQAQEIEDVRDDDPQVKAALENKRRDAVVDVIVGIMLEKLDHPRTTEEKRVAGIRVQKRRSIRENLYSGSY